MRERDPAGHQCTDAGRAGCRPPPCCATIAGARCRGAHGRQDEHCAAKWERRIACAGRHPGAGWQVEGCAANMPPPWRERGGQARRRRREAPDAAMTPRHPKAAINCARRYRQRHVDWLAGHGAGLGTRLASRLCPHACRPCRPARRQPIRVTRKPVGTELYATSCPVARLRIAYKAGRAPDTHGTASRKAAPAGGVGGFRGGP